MTCPRPQGKDDWAEVNKVSPVTRAHKFTVVFQRVGWVSVTVMQQSSLHYKYVINNVQHTGEYQRELFIITFACS